MPGPSTVALLPIFVLAVGLAIDF
ncbi:MAG: hypothetical protein JWL57_803, partial [Actinobacteria bacterium]|nr:hypothetical protein [Actinomycetota bacterium]